jgi:hypothetical protein
LWLPWLLSQLVNVALYRGHVADHCPLSLSLYFSPTATVRLTKATCMDRCFLAAVTRVRFQEPAHHLSVVSSKENLAGLFATDIEDPTQPLHSHPVSIRRRSNSTRRSASIPRSSKLERTRTCDGTESEKRRPPLLYCRGKAAREEGWIGRLSSHLSSQKSAHYVCCDEIIAGLNIDPGLVSRYDQRFLPSTGKSSRACVQALASG